MNNALQDLNFTPAVIRRIQKERIAQLEARIERLTKELYNLGQEHGEHLRMVQAIEGMYKPVSPGENNDIDF
jgi:vacuolar-type H+-ATPase subunit I/STV1